MNDQLQNFTLLNEQVMFNESKTQRIRLPNRYFEFLKIDYGTSGTSVVPDNRSTCMFVGIVMVMLHRVAIA